METLKFSAHVRRRWAAKNGVHHALHGQFRIHGLDVKVIKSIDYTSIWVNYHIQWIGLRENLNRKPSIFPLN